MGFKTYYMSSVTIDLTEDVYDHVAECVSNYKVAQSSRHLEFHEYVLEKDVIPFLKMPQGMCL